MADASIIEEIKNAIDNINFGSIEVFVQDGEVTQISTRIIKKTNVKTSKNSAKITGTVIRKASGNGININFKY